MERLEQETKGALIILIVNKVDQLLGYHRNNTGMDGVLRNCPYYE